LIECPSVFFKIRGNMTDIQTFAVGSGIRELLRLRKLTEEVGGVSGKASRTSNSRMVRFEADLHWYEASGIGKKEFKIKRFVD